MIVQFSKNPANLFKGNFKWHFILLITLECVFLFQISCKRYDIDFQVRQADSLIGMVSKAEESMLIDAGLLYLRIDSMQYKLLFLNTLDTNRMNLEFRYDLSRCNALYTYYVKRVEQYEALAFDNKRYLKITDELKKKVIDRDISKNEFNKEAERLRPLLEHHFNECDQLVRELLSTELMYQRLNVKITDFYNSNHPG